MNSTRTTKPPRQIFPTVYSFTPNRATLGGTSYFIAKNIAKNDSNNLGGILIDCPPWHEDTAAFLQAQGGVKTLFITHRVAISNQVAQIQAALNCEIVIQEQEAYLMPEATVTPFRDDWQQDEVQAIWTPGFSPGSACLYYKGEGGCLFTGRHLLPNQQGELLSLRTAKTFHWGRQLRSIEKLIQIFNTQNANALRYLLPAANTGFLRGVGFVENVTNVEGQLTQALERSQRQPNLELVL